MKRYSSERKEAILRRMMPPENKLVSELARENGISEQTLYTWRRNVKAQGVPVPGNGKNAEEWSSEDKFGVVLETAQLNEAELAEYCRRKGLFIEQIGAWRDACKQANAQTVERSREQREQSKSDRKRIKRKHPAAPPMNATIASPYSDFHFGDRDEGNRTQGVMERAGPAMA